MPWTADCGFAHLARDLDRVRHVLADAVAVSDDRIHEPLLHFIRRHGRLFRPTLALTSAYVLTPDTPASDAVVSSAAAVEILHLASLYHDDLCDKATTRRGYPTVNAQFGDAIALIAGDYLLASCTAIMASMGRDEVSLISGTIKVMCQGQMREILDLHNLERTEESYLSTIAGKTAKLISVSVMLGAALAGASRSQQKILASYGHHLGMAFQIWDDVLDLWAPESQTGKVSGTDIDNGVYTLPVIYALRECREPLASLLTSAEMTKERRHAVRRLLDQTGARHKAIRVAQQHVTQAMTELARLNSVAENDISRFMETARLMIAEADQLLLSPFDRPWSAIPAVN